MENYLNDNESRLFDLIETKDWEELSGEELDFVAQHISEPEYSLQRQILLEAADLYTDEIAPLPLTIPTTGKKPVIQKTIPLYQALLAVAATILVFIWIWPRENQSELAQTDTPAQQHTPETITETKYVYDTIVRYVTMAKNVEKAVVDTVHKIVSFSPIEAPDPKQLQASMPPLPELSKEKLSTAGISLKEENTSQLLPRIVNTIY